MIDTAIRYCEANKDRFVADLIELAKIPSVSAKGFPAEEVVRSARATAALMRRAGLEHVKLLRLPDTHPYVYGDWLHAPGKPTVLLYAHHDVQPPGRETLWKSPPFTPTKRSGRLYGRGAVDDKAGILVHTAGIEAFLKTSGKLPLNVKVIIEGEEEIGSENLSAFLKRHSKLMQADAIVLSDTSNFAVGLPSITTTLRGLASFDVTARTMDHPLHSGMWGGAIPDPVIALSKMIATLVDSQGRITVPGIYKEVRPLNSSERKAYAALRYSERDYRRETYLLPGVKLVGGSSSPVAKMWREPSISVNAIQASSRALVSNIVNESAWCHVGVRTVPDMDAEKTCRLLMSHLKRVAPWGVKVEFGPTTTASWWMTDPVGPAFDAARRAMKKGYGRDAAIIGTGGTIPFVEPFSDRLGGVPALLMGLEDPDSNPHSENESLHLGDFQKAIRTSVHLFSELADLRPGKKRS